MKSFAERAPRFFALAAQTLGWTPRTFWDATPRELVSALRPVGEDDGELDDAAVGALRALMEKEAS